MAGEDLLVEVGLSEKQYRAALARMEAQTVKSAKKNENTFKAANARVQKNFRTANAGASAFASGGLRQVSLQLSQVAQQASATGDPLRALAIQLPDIGLAFGTIGIAAGVAAGAILPLIANSRDASAATDTAKEAADSYRAAVESMRKSLDLANTSIEDLTARYGENAEAARQAAVIQAQIAAAAAERDASAALSAYSDVKSEMEQRLALYEQSVIREQQIRDAIEAQAASASDLADQQEITAMYAEKLEQATGRTVGENMELRNILNEMEAAMSSGTISGEFREAAERALALARETDSFDTELQDALQKAIDLELTEAELARLMDLVAGSAASVAGNISSAANEAGRFANEMARAAAVQLQSRVNAQQSKQYSGRGGDPRDFMDGGSKSGYESAAGYEPVDAIIARFTPSSGRSGGGGRRASSGGRSGGSGISDDLREVERLFEATRTEAEKYATEISEIEALHAKGLLDDDTYGRALDIVAEKYDMASSAAEGLASISDTVKDTILDFAETGTLAMDDLAASIKRAALQALLFGEGPLGSLFGGAGGGLLGGLFSGVSLPSFDGGGFTGYGSRSGGIDGKGGMPAILHPNETVIDHTKAGGSGQSRLVGGDLVLTDGGEIMTRVRLEQYAGHAAISRQQRRQTASQQAELSRRGAL